MLTLDAIRAKIKGNFPKETGSRRDVPLRWDRETAATIVTDCGRFRIAKHQDSERKTYEYIAYTIPGPHGPARKVAGPFITPKEARDAVQDYVNGQPMQQDLA